MSIQQVTISTEPLKYKRLLAVDITRIPNKIKSHKDTFCEHSEDQIKRLKRKSLLQKIFTVATFGVAGLYIAHRNDCFKPINKEVKNLLKEEAVLTRVKNFVLNANPLEHYPEFIKMYLTKLSKSDKANKALQDEALSVLSTPDRLTELTASIIKKAKEEKLEAGKVITKDEYNDGIFFALMEKIKIRLQTDLKGNKKNGVPYKDHGRLIFNGLFDKKGDTTTMNELLYDVIKGRISDKIEKYLDEAIINVK